MITLTRISGSMFVLNCDLIERIDSTPDTVVSLVDGKKYVVLESLHQVTALVRQHRSQIIALSGFLQRDEIELEDLEPTTPHLADVAQLRGDR